MTSKENSDSKPKEEKRVIVVGDSHEEYLKHLDKGATWPKDVAPLPPPPEEATPPPPSEESNSEGNSKQ